MRGSVRRFNARHFGARRAASCFAAGPCLAGRRGCTAAARPGLPALVSWRALVSAASTGAGGEVLLAPIVRGGATARSTRGTQRSLLAGSQGRSLLARLPCWRSWHFAATGPPCFSTRLACASQAGA
eukprot:488204-Alexandrium_andersonii.AAC.1